MSFEYPRKLDMTSSNAASLPATVAKSQPIQFAKKPTTYNHYNNFILSPTFIEHSNSNLDNSIATNVAAKKNTENSQSKANGLYLNEINEFSNNRVSAFLPYEEIIANDQAGAKIEIVSKIFDNVRAQEGNVDNLIRVISYHPQFLHEFMGLYNYLMYSPHGALPCELRHFIAIMAATRHRCIYLVKQQEREFQSQNGQKAWLHGLNHIPQKLKDLYELNKLLCHQPWLINQNHIEKILKGQISWTVTELTMAVTILTLFHSLSGFAFGCGINENYVQQLQIQYELEQEEKRKRTQRAALCAAQLAAAAVSNAKKKSKKRTVRHGKHHEHSDEDDYDNGYSEEDEDNEEYEGDDDEDDHDADADDYDQEYNDENHLSDNNHQFPCHYHDHVNNRAHNGDFDNGESNLMHNGALNGRAADAAMNDEAGKCFSNRTSRSNYRNGDSNSASHIYNRARSNSTGTSNRTLSNSSASSCELGIDMLLKEMQMIKAEDKTISNQQLTGSCSFKSSSSSLLINNSNPMGAMKPTVNQSSSSHPVASSLVSAATVASAINTARYASMGSASLPSPGGALNLNNLSSGTNTITNSPIQNTAAGGTATIGAGVYHSSYLSDLSNTELTNGGAHNHHYHSHSHNHHQQANCHHNATRLMSTSHYHDNNNNTISQNGDAKALNNENGHEDNSAAAASGYHCDDMDSEIESMDNELDSMPAPFNKPPPPLASIIRTNLSSSSSSSLVNENQRRENHPEQQHHMLNQPVNTITNANANANPLPNPNNAQLINQKIKDYMLKYAYDPDYTYLDFKHADQSLKLEYYTWENQGYITASHLYPDICELLDKNFTTAVNMTYNTMGTITGVDTSLFRKAVWYYTHSLFGVKYDDYDYNQIRILLKSPLRKFIKIICSSPQKITKSHYDSIMKEFTHSEKVHVNIVIMQARMQASMLYFLRAVNSYFI